LAWKLPPQKFLKLVGFGQLFKAAPELLALQPDKAFSCSGQVKWLVV
jgi:hypothetical protein